MWLAAVCSLMNSSAPISRLLSPRGDEPEDLDLAGGEAVRAAPAPAPRRAERARRGAAASRMPIALGERHAASASSARRALASRRRRGAAAARAYS